MTIIYILQYYKHCVGINIDYSDIYKKIRGISGYTSKPQSRKKLVYTTLYIGK